MLKIGSNLSLKIKIIEDNNFLLTYMGCKAYGLQGRWGEEFR